MKLRAIIVHPEDNVATATAPLHAGDMVRDAAGESVLVQNDIPLWHKVAITGIREGAEIRKYGECIGLATRAIAPGEHVHAHNVKPEEE